MFCQRLLHIEESTLSNLCGYLKTNMAPFPDLHTFSKSPLGPQEANGQPAHKLLI
jgi:hypothetical protein